MGNWKIDEDITENTAIYYLFKKYQNNDPAPFIDYESDKLNTIRAHAFHHCHFIRNFNASKITNVPLSAFNNSTIESYDLVNVYQIGNYAFNNCTNFHGNITSAIRFNGTMTANIGNHAFYNDDKITAINYNNANFYANAFGLDSQRDGLQGIYVVNIRYVGDNCFCNQSNLKVISGRYIDTMTNYLTNIQTNAFKGCINLTTINVANIEDIKHHAFYGCTNLKNLNCTTMKNIANDAFGFCTSLTDIQDMSLTNVNGSFRGCSSLTNLTNVTLAQIYSKGFDSLTALNKVVINNIDSSTNSNIFNNCTQLNYIQINSGTINEQPFRNIGNTELTVNLTNQTCIPISVGAFKNSVKTFYANQYTGTFPEGMFQGYTTLYTVNIKNVTNVANNMFNGCTSLTEVHYNGNVGHHAFANCTLTTWTQRNVKFIDNYGYYNGFADKHDWNATWADVESIGNYVFTNVNYNTINLPNLTCIYTQSLNGFKGKNLNLNKLPTCPISMCDQLMSLETISINKCSTISDYAFNGCENLVTVNCNSGTSTLESLIVTISNYAFANCKKLQEFITCSRTITIKDYAFDNCHALDSFNGTVKFDTDGSHQFSWCQNLSKIKLNSSVTTIPERCFQNTYNLKQINLDITQLQPYSFANSGIETAVFNATKEVSFGEATFWQSDIKTITWPKIAKCDKYVFSKTKISSANLANIRDYTGANNITNQLFDQSTLLTTITDLDHTINSYAFNGCTSLKNISGQISNIDTYAFKGCTALVTWDCPTNYVLAHAFNGCTGLKYVKNIAYVGANAFNGLTSITNLVNVNNIGSNAFYGCTGLINAGTITNIGVRGFYNCKNLETIGTSWCTTISSNSFSGCAKLKGPINIDSSITTISNYAFNGCAVLNYVNVGAKNQITIGNYTFNGCVNFRGINFSCTPSITLKSYAFNGCTQLTYNSFNGKSITINPFAFNGCTSLCLSQSYVFTVPNDDPSATAHYNRTIPTHAFTNSYVNFVMSTSYNAAYMVTYIVASNAFDNNSYVELQRNTSADSSSKRYMHYYRIEEYGFNHCETVKLVGGIFNSIATNAFNGCNNVQIFSNGRSTSDGSSSDTYLGTNQFSNAGNVEVHGDIIRIELNTFYNCKNANLYLTNSTVKDFTANLTNIDIDNSSNSYKRVYLFLPNASMQSKYKTNAKWKAYFKNTTQIIDAHILIGT